MVLEGKARRRTSMNENEETLRSQHDQQAPPVSSPDSANQPETRTRRELIERYGKYAIVAAPLLLFASKAHALHSKP
jgi:hypothetical protein